MKRLIATSVTWLLGFSILAAATRYVDKGCANNGNGTAVNCSASVGGAGPWNSVANAIAGSVCGDTVEFRGVHDDHGTTTHSPAGAFDGIYFGYDYNDMHGKACSSGSPLVFQPYGYTGPGTGEVVYMSSISAVTWTQCVWTGTCDCGVIGDGTQAACEETWYKAGTSPYTDVVGALKNDGSPTYRVASKAAMTNATAGYNAKACSDVGAVDYTWMRCNTDVDCPNGSTCDAAQSPEIDSYSTQVASSNLYVRWATNPNAAGYKARIYNSDDGITWFIYNSSYITIRGFNFRGHAREAISFVFSGAGCSNCTMDDNRVYYSGWKTGGGPDYGLASRKSSPATITNNNIAYTTSEGIHVQSLATGANTITISGNWIHDLGDVNVLGPASVGTPAGMILTDDYQGADTNNFSGSIINNNLIQRVGSGILLEDRSSGWIVRDNYLQTMTNDGIKFDGTVHASSNQVYNNIVDTAGRGCLYSSAGGGGSWSSNLIYNNTFVGCANWAMEEHTSGATNTGNIFRNNILYNSSTPGLVDFPNLTGANGNVFQNNIAKSTAGGTIINFGASSFTCAQTITSANIDGTAGADSNSCVDPVFVSSTNFHLQTTSPAKDAGVSTGMPSGHTRSINNTLADRHSLPKYNGIPQIGSAWDIGACEYKKRQYFNVSEFKWKRPEPWLITNAAFLRLKKEIEN